MDRISASQFGVDKPLPLRINKKREAENPDHYRRHSVAFSPTLPNLHTVPTRQSSLPRSHSISREKSAVVNGQEISVQKRRNTVTDFAPNSITSNTPDGAMPATCPQCGTQLSNGDKAKKKVTFRVDQKPHRASTGQLLNDGPLAPTPLITRSRSSATVRQGSKRDVVKHEHDDQPSNQGINRRLSLSGKVMTRMMNGFTSRQNASHALVKRDGSTKDHKADTQEHRDDIPSNQRVNTEQKKRVVSLEHRDIDLNHRDETSRQHNGRTTYNMPDSTVLSDLNSDSLVGSVLDNALSAFPTPPTITNSTSPTTHPSMATPRSGIEVLEPSHTCEGVAVVGAEINAVADIAQLESEDAHSIFVAVEIKGILNRPEDGDDLQPHALEAAVVIDNS